MKLTINILIIFLVVHSFSLKTYGQAGEMNQKDLAFLKQSTTYFVLDEEDSTLYNKHLINHASKYWTFTKFQFIKYSQLEEYAKRPDASFILKLTFGVNTGTSGGDYAYQFNSQKGRYEKGFSSNAPGLSYRYDGIVLVNGGRNNIKFAWKDWLAYALIDNVLEPENFYFRLGNYVQVIQNTVQYFDNTGDKNLNLSKSKELYNERVSGVKDKVLYIRKADLGPKIDFQKAKGSYKYNCELVTDKQIEKAIANQDPNVVLLNHVTTANRYYPYLTLAKGGEVIYIWIWSEISWFILRNTSKRSWKKSQNKYIPFEAKQYKSKGTPSLHKVHRTSNRLKTL